MSLLPSCLMAISSGYSQDPLRSSSIRRRRYLRVLGVVALPVAGALLLSACSGPTNERIVNLSSGSNGADSVTPSEAPTPSAVATVVSGTAAKAIAAANAKDEKAAEAAAGTSAGGATAAHSSGKGWKVDFFDGFNGHSLNRKLWGVYNGTPKHNAISTWKSNMVSVSNGSLWLKTTRVNGKWVTGGVSNAVAGAKKYGKWSIRYRMPAAAGISYVVLLYPSNGGWPPEYDVAEDYDGGNRQQAMSTLHWGSANNQQHRYLKANFSQWTTVTETSTPGKTTIAVNGKVQVKLSNAAGVPSIPMWMGIQTQVNHCSAASAVCVGASTPDGVAMQVAWVAHETYVG